MSIPFYKHILIFCTNIIQKLEIQTLLSLNEIFQQKNIHHTIHRLIQQNNTQTDILSKQLTIQSNNSIEKIEHTHAPLADNTVHYNTSFPPLSISDINNNTNSNTKEFINTLIQLNQTIDTVLLNTIKKTNTSNHNTHTNTTNNIKQSSKRNIPIFLNKENQYFIQLIRILKATIDGYITNNKNTILQCIEQCSGIDFSKIHSNKKDTSSSSLLSKNTFIIRFHELLLQTLKSISIHYQHL